MSRVLIWTTPADAGKNGENLASALEEINKKLNYHSLVVVGIRDNREVDGDKETSTVDLYTCGCRNCGCDALAVMLSNLDSEDLVYILKQVKQVETIKQQQKTATIN